MLKTRRGELRVVTVKRVWVVALQDSVNFRLLPQVSYMLWHSKLSPSSICTKGSTIKWIQTPIVGLCLAYKDPNKASLPAPTACLTLTALSPLMFSLSPDQFANGSCLMGDVWQYHRGPQGSQRNIFLVVPDSILVAENVQQETTPWTTFERDS